MNTVLPIFSLVAHMVDGNSSFWSTFRDDSLMLKPNKKIENRDQINRYYCVSIFCVNEDIYEIVIDRFVTWSLEQNRELQLF